jgi:CO/xanthine dehydrogenase FAD-binding subunit
LLVSEFYTSDGIWNRDMGRDELVVAVTVPAPSPRLRASFQKLRSRSSIDFPLANLAAAAELDGDGTVRSLRMVVSAMASYPRRVGRVEEAAVGNRLTTSVIDAVASQAFRQCHPLENITVDADWRRAMVPVLVRRALKEARSEVASRGT